MKAGVPLIYSMGLLTCLLLSSFLFANATPLTDLASPDQATRDAAAKIVRKTYSPSVQSQWDPLMHQLVSGISTEKLHQLLQPYHATDAGSDGSGGSSTRSFRL